MAMTDFFLSHLNTNGWLSIATLYFDNSRVINVFDARGYVAYSPANESFFTFGVLDTSDTEIIENTLVTIDPGFIGQQQVLTCLGLEHMQNFDIALYSHRRWYRDEDTALPYPVYPKEAELTGMSPDPDTGLYADSDTVTTMSMGQRSTIDLYGHMLDYNEGDPYSGANIDFWKLWYGQHNKFIQFLNSGFGVTDAI